jgi:hypothetical protein
MTVFAVTFDGTRFNEVQDYTNWSNYGGTGAGGTVEPSIAYQNGQCAARLQKTTGGTLGGIQLDDASTVNMTATDRDLWFVKAYITDFFDTNLTEGLRVGIGDGGDGTSHSYNMSGTTATNDAFTAAPAQGGYILTAIDPANTFWPIAIAGGGPDLTIIDWFGIQGSWINANAKSVNIAMDAIDIGVGLYLTGGTGADPVATFTSYPIIDQDIFANRWGVCSGAGANVSAWGILRAGGTIEFDDSTSIVSFKDGYHGAGFTGVLHELDTAAATFDVGATIIGEGKLYNSGAIDTRPDYVVTGTTMTDPYNFSANLRNHRNITFNTKVDCDGGDIECQLLVQDTAEIQNSTIRTNALTSIACLQDPTFGTTSDLHDTDFIQTGVGHAIELATIDGTYTFTGLTFTGYGATTTDDAALDITAGSGTTTINYTGDAPTYKTAGATVVLIGDPSTTKITVEESGGSFIENARVFLETDDDGGGSGLPYQDATDTLTSSGTTATLTASAVHGLANNDYVVVRGASDQYFNKTAQIAVTSTTIFTYTVNVDAGASAGGTPVFSYCPLSGLTNASGVITSDKVWPASQGLTGWTRKSTTTPFFRQSALSITDASTGTDLLVVLQADE